jgi:hypothetical protein
MKLGTSGVDNFTSDNEADSSVPASHRDLRTQIGLKTILTLDMRLHDDVTCSAMKSEPSISFNEMDIELMAEITFSIRAWTIESSRVYSRSRPQIKSRPMIIVCLDLQSV